MFFSGDIERLRMQSGESEAEKLALRERIDQLMRSQQELESRATSLQLTVDRLTLALAKTEEEEQAFKEKVLNFTVKVLNTIENELKGTQFFSTSCARCLKGYSLFLFCGLFNSSAFVLVARLPNCHLV